ncbi:MAG: PH domain-containing protein [Gemmatimonadetes bacterium]|nr:PH domain-containing protein [Gemmatimonadota bacterium]
MTGAKIDSVTISLEEPAWVKWTLLLSVLAWAVVSVLQYATGQHPVLWLVATALSLLSILFGMLRRARTGQGMSDAYLRVDPGGMRIKRLLSRPRRFPWKQVQRVWLRSVVVEIDLRGGRRERCVLIGETRID